MSKFKIAVEFDATDPDSEIMCTVSSGSMSYAETEAAMIRLRDHLTARLEAAETECPFYEKHAAAMKAANCVVVVDPVEYNDLHFGKD